MRIKRIDFTYVIIAFLVIYIILMLFIINNKNKNTIVNIGSDDIAIEFLVSGSYDNIGCLSVYIDNEEEGNEYSFNSGSSWQKSNYGAIYRNGKTIIIGRNKNKEVFYQKEINVTSIVDDAPVIKMDFDNLVNGTSDTALLKDVSASVKGNNITSSVKVNILDKVEDEVLVSYLAESNNKKCYLVKYATVVESSVTPLPTTIPSPTAIPTIDKWTWPTTKPYSISQYFKENKHNGVDIYGPKRGSAIYAARDGDVVEITHNSTSGYYVTIKHDNGYYTRYAHMQNIYGNDKTGSKGSATKYIKVGERVKAGRQIGEIGSSGRSTGTHLHFEIWNGKPFKSKAFNPLNFYK